MLSVVGKLYGRELIKRVRAGNDCAIGEEQFGFRQFRGCMDQVFAAWTKVCMDQRCMDQSILQMGKMYSWLLWIWKRPMILSIDMVCGRC